MSQLVNATAPRGAPYFDSIFEHAPSHDGTKLRIGIVMSRFNREVGEGLLSAAVAELRRLGVADHDVTLATVPGALEIPLTLQTLAQSGRVDAMIALGTVIRGETYHFEVVSNDACRGIMETQLETGIPVANGLLTCEDDDQARVRMANKGRDCAQAAVEMARLQAAIRERASQSGGRHDF
ncbi:MAG: 6,7-dimethyl-8-ribityllumazine synthase [Zoogloeaceae bacterium]|jgi:6,7-dimethyl-8-ribityllumazine synthase|nr:6,7-dimethyl-8-ribityllumazine synthase [Zoogloeaceae bacterium]